MLSCFKSVAVANHIIRNDVRESASNTMDNDSVIGNPPTFVTYKTIGYGNALTNGEPVKYVSR